jgi:hypothetical protein
VTITRRSRDAGGDGADDRALVPVDHAHALAQLGDIVGRTRAIASAWSRAKAAQRPPARQRRMDAAQYGSSSIGCMSRWPP